MVKKDTLAEHMKTCKEDKDGNSVTSVTEVKVDDELDQPNFKIRRELELDYKEVKNVKETLEVLKSERLKGKFDTYYHVKVLNCMVDQFKPDNLDEKRLKVNVTLYLIGTLFMTIKTDLGYFDRD